MRLIIKLPIGENGRFKLQSRGNIHGRQYKTAAGVTEALEGVFSGTGLKEKMTIVIKEDIGSHFENINETLSSNDREYLLYCTACFLEDYISKNSLRKAEKRWTKFISLKEAEK